MSDFSTIIKGKLLIEPQENYNNEVTFDDIMELVNGLSKTRRVTRKLSKIQKNLDYKRSDYDTNGFYYYPKNDFENFGQTIDKSVINFNRPPDFSPSLWLDFEVVKKKVKKNGKYINRYYLVWNGEKENNQVYTQEQWIYSLILYIFNPVKMSLNGNISIYNEYSNEKSILNIKNNVGFKNENIVFRPYKKENIIATKFFKNIIKKNQEKPYKKENNNLEVIRTSSLSITIEGKLLIEPQEDYNNEVLFDDIMELVNGLSKTRRITRQLSKIQKNLDYKRRDYNINGYYYYPKNDFENFGETFDKSIINFNRPPMRAPSLWLDFEVIKEKENTNGEGVYKYYLTWNGEKENNTIIEEQKWIMSLIDNVFNPVKMSLNGNLSIFNEYTKEKSILNIKNNEVFKSDNMIFRPFKDENLMAKDFFRNIIKKNQEKDLKKKSNLNNNEQQTINII